MPYGPVISTPFTDFAWTLVTSPLLFNPNTVCSKLHLRYLDCIEAYGMQKGKNQCAELFYDISECQTRSFQIRRAEKIRRERMKQYREGKLKQPFLEHPPLDSYLYV